MKQLRLNRRSRGYGGAGRRKTVHRRVALAIVLVASLGVIAGSGLFWVKRKLTHRYDILILGGLVLDGTGAPGKPGAVGIRDGKIVEVAWPYFAEADRIIGAHGLVVAPGFIDVHTHIESSLVGSRRAPLLAANFLAQGFTTIITGNCGRSARSISQFFAQIESHGSQINVGTLVGHNTVRREVMKEASRAPTDAELKKMCQLVAGAMRDGALGLSTGLEYTPGMFAEPKEIEALAAMATQYHGIYATHMRDEGNDAIKSLEEALSVARRARIPLQISHLKWRGRLNWGKSKRLIEMIIEAQRSGSRVTCDAYPYTASSTTLDVLIPKTAREGGGEKFRERLRDPVSRKRIVNETVRQIKSEGWRDFSFARVAYCDFAPEYNGMTISEIASLVEKTKHHQEIGTAPDLSRLKPAKSIETAQRAQRERRSPGPSSVESQAEAICYLASRGSVQMIYENMSEDDVANILQFSDCMLGSDSNIRNGEGRPHPRGYGSAPRLLSLFVRERALFPVEEAIRRMTSLPAETFGIANRGKLLTGYWADVVIFDPSEIKDEATYESPFRAPDGILYVLVSGQVALDHGQAVSLNAGRVIKRDF